MIVVGVAVEAVVEIVVAIVANVIAYDDYVGKALSMMLRRQLQLYLVGTGC